MARGKDIVHSAVIASPTFEVDSVALNPRLDDIFRSASLSAKRYDMYEFTELRFRYVPTAAVTTSPGVVFLAWEPNANRGQPDDGTDGVPVINAYEYHSEGPVYSETIELRVNPQHLPPPRYCRAGPTSSDLNFYDTGKLLIATDACSGTPGDGSTVGYVEAYYTIKFYSYHLEDTTPVQYKVAKSNFTDLATAASGSELVPTSFTENFAGELAAVEGTGGWTLPPGKYLVRASSQLYASAAANITLTLKEDASNVVSSTISDIGAANYTRNYIVEDIITSTGSENYTVVATATSGTITSNNGRLIIQALS